jgi:hypothetical protein
MLVGRVRPLNLVAVLVLVSAVGLSSPLSSPDKPFIPFERATDSLATAIHGAARPALASQRSSMAPTQAGAAPVTGAAASSSAAAGSEPARVCTLYASPTGRAEEAGDSASTATSLREAVRRVVPGSVVCLLAGDYRVRTPFQLTRAGAADNWIVFTSYDGDAIIRPGELTHTLFQTTTAARYVEINGITFDGENIASGGISVMGSQHIRLIGNTIRNTGAAGIATYPDPATGSRPDYIFIDGNRIHRVGYHQGWASGIHLNTHSWSDQYPGFHTVVTRNIISGSFDNSTYISDGNGVVVEHGHGGGRGDTPPVLIANNLVYNNGGRGIEADGVARVFIINNTVWQNGLDRRKTWAEIMFHGASGSYAVNNIAYAWGPNAVYLDTVGSPATYRGNLWFTAGTGQNQLPAAIQHDAEQVRQADPLLVDPPILHPSNDHQYTEALPPEQAIDRFRPQPASPATDAGIDPSGLPGLAPEVVDGLRAYLATDIEGKRRPEGVGFDAGAYECQC